MQEIQGYKPSTVSRWLSVIVGFYLGILADDGTYTSLRDGFDVDGPRTWTILQGSGTTETYAVRCQGSGGLWSPWSEPPTVVTLS
jgi:hypothetical protein